MNTIGSRRRRSQSTDVDESEQEKTIAPSSGTSRAGIDSHGFSAVSRVSASPVGASSAAIDAIRSVANWSVNAYCRLSVSMTPTAPSRPRARARPDGSGPQ